MAKDVKKSSKKRIPPTLTPEARENRLISLAMDAAEKQLMEGTASAQVITHYLRLGSSKGKLERGILEKDMELKEAKTKMIQSTENVEKLYNDAMEALKSYQSMS